MKQGKSVPAVLVQHIRKNIAKPFPDPSCKYKPRTCYQPALENYEYCLKHILEDKNAPFRACSYVYPSNTKRCCMPARQLDKVENSYCALHLWKTQVGNERKSSKHTPLTTPEFLLSGLAHYVRPAKVSSNTSEDSKNPSRTKPINPFLEADTNRINQKRAFILDCVSESDSDVEPATLDNIWQGADEDSSDAESIDSQLDDPLKHAGHYTAEEVVAIARNKMTRLQCLYQKQIDRLQYLYKARKLHYLQALKKEKETLCSIYNQARTTAREQKLYEKLRAMNRYNRKSHAHALAYYKSMAKRTKDVNASEVREDSITSSAPSSLIMAPKNIVACVSERRRSQLSNPELTKGSYKPQTVPPRCSFSEGGVRCSKLVLPYSKFCHQHILQDPNQLLFKPCDCDKADSKCQVPVTSVGSEETCILHVRLPQLPHSSNYPDSMKMDIEDKKSIEGSEVDASATESAFSTDPRDSPENSIFNNEDMSQKDEVSLPIKAEYEEVQAELTIPSDSPGVIKEEIIEGS